MEPDRGTTNVRNTTSRHWLRWLEPANRCLVPLTAFSEPDQMTTHKQRHSTRCRRKLLRPP